MVAALKTVDVVIYSTHNYEIIFIANVNGENFVIFVSMCVCVCCACACMHVCVRVCV